MRTTSHRSRRAAFAFRAVVYDRRGICPLMVMPMDVFEAVDFRIACRWFFDKPVDIKSSVIHRRAARAASGGIRSRADRCTDRRAARCVQGEVQAHLAGVDPATTTPNIRSTRRPCASPTRTAARSTACSFTARSASTAPIRGRLAQYKRNFEFFDAPVALFIAIDRHLGPRPMGRSRRLHPRAGVPRVGYGLDTGPEEIGLHAPHRPRVAQHAAGTDAIRCRHRLWRPRPPGDSFRSPRAGACGSSGTFLVSSEGV